MEPNQQLSDDLMSLIELDQLVDLELALSGTPNHVKAEYLPLGAAPRASPLPSPVVEEIPSPMDTKPPVEDLLWLTQAVGLNIDNLPPNMKPEDAVEALVASVAACTEQNSVATNTITPTTVSAVATQIGSQIPVLPPQHNVGHQGSLQPTRPSRLRRSGSRNSNVDLDDDDLVLLPVRELNRRLQGIPKDLVTRLKQKRRTLKNRGYAQNCRSKRMQQRFELEKTNEELIDELSELRDEMSRIRHERDIYKRQCDQLRIRSGSESSFPGSPDSMISQ